MTSAENSRQKVITTEYVDTAKTKKVFTPQQQELVDALNSYASWDDFEADISLFKAKHIKFRLENHASYYNYGGIRTKSLNLDEFIHQAETESKTLGEVLSQGLEKGQYKFRVYEGKTYLCFTGFHLFVTRNPQHAQTQTNTTNNKSNFDWQGLLGTAVSVALPKLVETLAQPKQDNIMQQMMLDYMKQNDEQRREDRKEFKDFMKNNSANDDPLHLLDLMQRLDDFKSTLAKPPAPPPINSGSKWEKIAEKLIDNFQQPKAAPTAPVEQISPAPTYDPQQVITDLRERIYAEIDNQSDAMVVLMSLRDLYMVASEVGLENVPEYQQAGSIEDAFSLFLSKADDQEYQNQLIQKAQELLPLLKGGENGSAG
jgi:hypothetical protein